MKKLLGISLVAMLAVSPLAANAAAVAGSPTSYGENQPTGDAKAAVLGGAPLYQLVEANTATDGNAASAGYVKGAYNAAIKAVNKVHDEVTSLNTNALTTAGNGLAKDGNTVSVDMTTNGGLQFTGETDGSKTVGVKAGNGIELDSTGVNVKAKTNGGITVDSTGVSLTNGVQGATNTTTYTGTGLTTQGYVDEKVATVTSGMVTETGTQELSNKTLNGGTLKNGTTLTATGATISGGTISGATIDASANTISNITASQMATSAKATGTANNDKVTTQGYVDDAITGLGNTYATQTGVVQTIKAATVSVTDNRTISSSAGGSIAVTTNVPIMTDWSSPNTVSQTPLAATSTADITNLTVTSNLTGNAPTAAINAASVSYNTVDCTDNANSGNAACQGA